MSNAGTFNQWCKNEEISHVSLATAASGLLYACVPKGMHGSLGTTVPDPSLNLGQVRKYLEHRNFNLQP